MAQENAVAYQIRFASEVMTRFHTENPRSVAAGQEAIEAAAIRVRGFIDSFRGSYGGLPATGDYLEMNPHEAYAVQSRSFIEEKGATSPYILLLLRDVRS